MKINVLPDEQMRDLGFTDYAPERWFFWKHLVYDISFNMAIEKDGSSWSIDVLDDVFLQPYDYQYLMTIDHPSQVAFRVKELVDRWMMYMVKAGIVEDWEVGDYV